MARVKVKVKVNVNVNGPIGSGYRFAAAAAKAVRSPDFQAAAEGTAIDLFRRFLVPVGDLEGG